MIVNVHERKLPASPEQVGALLDRLFGPEDCLWPAERWPMHRSGELRIGAACHQTPSCGPRCRIWFRRSIAFAWLRERA